jgi:outer membrane receptor protein involved in Fe transport
LNAEWYFYDVQKTLNTLSLPISMKRVLPCLLLFLIFTWCAQAENAPSPYQITGKVVVKSDGKDIPYATITLRNDSNKLLQRLSSDANGKFRVPLTVKGKYLVIATATGYQETTKQVEINTSDTDLGKIEMAEGVALKEATVSAQKPLVRVEADKITYSVESDPDAQTSNGLEILRKVPLLAVDGEDNVTLNGQSNYKVLVNGKSSSMMSKNFKEVIKSLPANSIKDIEVITTPSTKYEAEGVGGIINIITFKKTLNGYNGSISAGFDNWGSLNGSVYLSTKINKFGFSGRYSGSQNIRPPSEGFYASENLISDDKHFTRVDFESDNKGIGHNFSGEASYDIDTFNLISASFWGYLGSGDNNSTSTNEVTSTTGTRTQYFENSNTGDYTYGSISGNIDYQKTYMKPDKSFTLSYKFETDPRTSNYYNHLSNCFNYTAYNQKTIRKDLGQEHTFQVDYYDPITKMHQIECGIKLIYRNNDNSSERWRNDTLREEYSNALHYDQIILGAYAGYVFKLKKLTAKSGFRLERTWNEGLSSSTSDTTFTNRLYNLVPYVSFSYQIKMGQTIKASYTQRLQRPGVYYLNPYVNNSNPLYISYGNPNLDSEISHSFELGYSTFAKKFSYNTSLNASLNNNSIEEVSSMNALGVTTTTYANIGLAQRYGWNHYLSYRQGSKWNVYMSGTVSYVRYKANNGQHLSNEGFNVDGRGGFRVSLWKDASVNGNGGYTSPSIYLQGKYAGYSYSSLGFSQYFLKRKMQMSLNVSNPFTEKRRSFSDSKGENYTSHSESYYYYRSARVSLTYNFGKLDTSVKKAKRSINNDDVKGGSGGG